MLDLKRFSNVCRKVLSFSLLDIPLLSVKEYVDSALELYGNSGGLTEYIIPNGVNNSAVKVKNISGVNPEF